jgi:hypothetical protein
MKLMGSATVIVCSAEHDFINYPPSTSGSR